MANPNPDTSGIPSPKFAKGVRTALIRVPQFFKKEISDLSKTLYKVATKSASSQTERDRGIKEAQEAIAQILVDYWGDQ